MKRDCFPQRWGFLTVCRKGNDHRPEGACAEGAAAKPRERREWAGSVGAQGVACRTSPGAEEAWPQREWSGSLKKNSGGGWGCFFESPAAGLEKPGGLARVDRAIFLWSRNSGLRLTFEVAFWSRAALWRPGGA